MFWDGSRWVPEDRVRRIGGRDGGKGRRLRDWLATIPIIVLVPALLSPFMSVGAAGPSLVAYGDAVPNGSVAVVGDGFVPGTGVQLLWDGSRRGMPSVTISQAGTFSASVGVPATATAGPHSLAAVSGVGRGTWQTARSDRPSANAILATTTLTVSDPATPTAAPTATLTATAAPATTPTPTAAPTATPTATAAPTAVPTATPTPTAAPTATLTATAAPATTPTPTAAPTATLTATPTPTAAPTATPTATAAPTAVPTATPAPAATSVTTYCGTSLQARVDAAASGSVLDLSGCTFGGSVTIAKPLTLIGAALRVPSGSRGITVAASGVTLRGLTVTGTQSAVYRSAENGIYASSSIDGLTIEDSEVADFGQAGIWVGPVSNLTVSGNSIHDVFYAGVMVLSGSGGSISGNLVQRVGVGWTQSIANGGSLGTYNAYGIALSQTGGPVTSDFTVNGNTIEDVPTWHALDTHSGVRIAFTNNIVRRSSRAIFITSSVSRATDITVTGNQLLSPAPVTYNLKAVTTVDTLNVTITGNTLQGWGGYTIYDYGGSSTNLVVSGNTILP